MLYDAVEVVVAFGGVYVDVAVDFVVFRCCGFWGVEMLLWFLGC